MARPPRASLLAGALVLALAACQRDEETASEVTPRRERSRELADALATEQTPSALLAALAQSHRDLRAQLGPHRLHYTGRFALAPVEDPGRPKVDEPVLQARAVSDELTLEWGSTPDEPMAFRLEQHDDADDSREIIVLDERAYTQLEHRSWFWRELDSELHELWLDDAVRCMHDAVALAAPRLAISVSEGEAVGGRETLAITLGLADGSDPTLLASGPGAEWRRRAEIESISGHLVIDRASGAWLEGEAEVGYALSDALGRKLRGRVKVEGRLEPAQSGEIRIVAPQGAEPVPERERHELERAKLLDGLAAP